MKNYHRKKSKSITSLEEYLSLFSDVTDEKAIGEASPFYLYNERAPERIKKYIPDAKLIAILRNPVERAFSHYLDESRRGNECLSNFAKAIAEEDFTKNNPYTGKRHYVRFGFYYIQLKRYFDKFDRKQIKVYLYDDWKANNLMILKEIFGFLNIDDSFVPDMSVKHNISRFPRIWLLHRFLQYPNPIKGALKPLLPQSAHSGLAKFLIKRNSIKSKIPLQARKQLLAIYRKDILKLQVLIERDLSKWLEF